MTYVMSDIHGCFAEYQKALQLIDFQETDTLYVLGDCVDRGPEPMKLLLDMMERPNVIPLIGNHDLTALWLLKKLCKEITIENVDNWLDLDIMEAINEWCLDGGDITLNDFRKLPREKQADVLDYLGEFTAYEEIEVGDKSYVLVHGGFEPFVPKKALEDYDLTELIMSRRDLSRIYFPNRYTVTGHTPTITEEGNRGTIIHRNNHIAIDCGCAFGYNLAVLCLDTGEEFYVPSISKQHN